MSRAESVANAYAVLGLEQGVSLEVVKNTYKQAALRTHPDKNPGNPDATAEFQRVGEAYNVLLKHLDTSSRAPRPPFAFRGSDDSDAEYYDDEFGYDDDDDYLDEDELSFYLFLFERVMHGSRFRSGGYGPPPGFRPGTAPYRPPREEPRETREEQAERLRRAREQQEAAELRRKREASIRKELKQQDRQKERTAAEQRQKAKNGERAAKAKAQREQAEDVARAQREKAQMNRSTVFQAARKGDVDQVKQGVWEDNVDAAGGEVKPGHEDFVKIMPNDAQETLLHIAARQGDTDLVKWLDAHGAEIEERDGEDRTAFHVAVQYGHQDIITHFFDSYSPKDPDHSQVYAFSRTNVLSLALQSHEPQVVWMVLQNGLATSREINHAWSWITSTEGQKSMNQYSKGVSGDVEGKLNDILKLLMRYGELTPPPTPISNRKNDSTQDSVSGSQSQSQSPSPSPPSQQPHQRQAYRGRGRGRGKAKGRGRGRG
ncbi:hypothetical protein GYMLUDRAFT_45835 [Collybiopsis luxurians FD-317 M1]|uniref:J domain-containing protein n=1 Tax=Collybiopsis luxurians FD-317 M1 TaxID=944289 RepID=A0A0D0CHF3_9AGAR|nr:hypothetical protein GYMLUDRAFT_45835 [Collybiopsis luxurians FD-317 M1]